MEVLEFLKFSNGSGDGSDYGYGDGSGSGEGAGSGYGSGSGEGAGSGYGSGSGEGAGSDYRYGYGSGSGDGSDYGSGDGSGDGYGLKSINNQVIYIIDGVPTVIDKIAHGIAIGNIVNNDLTLTKCYIVKRNNMFAHGVTVKQAMGSVLEKLFNGMSVEERIEMFLEEFNLTNKYPAMKFFDWHNKLTGSCEMGRKSFAKNHNINLETDKFTVMEFIEITKNDYGSNVINQLKATIDKK